jgi:hypothetical protein
MADDPELKAIKAIMEAMKPLDETGRSRVLDYVLKRLQMTALSDAPIAAEVSATTAAAFANRPFKDIRSLTAEKQPRSANEMVALIAYYLSEVAQGDEAADTVNVDKIRKYFKLAAFPMPRVLKNVLINAAAAGYLESISRGEYRLNPVGYNLVVHGLPRASGSPAVKARHHRR